MRTSEAVAVIVARREVHETIWLSVKEIRNSWEFYQLLSAPESYPDWLEAQSAAYPSEVGCEVCGGNYVKGEVCLEAITEFDDYFDPQQPNGHHVTYQNPVRPWNR